MKITSISDLHGSYPSTPGGDLLIIAGDLTANDTRIQYMAFSRWLREQKYRKKIIIAGNHDGLIAKGLGVLVVGPESEYLQDNSTEFEGLKIWGSPWTPNFCDWDFMKERGADIKAKWDLIPDDIDILVTHGPPWGVCDSVDGRRTGCEELCHAVARIKPKLHVFGHIHEGYGIYDMRKCQDELGSPRATVFVNASHMDGNYNPINPPIEIEL